MQNISLNLIIVALIALTASVVAVSFGEDAVGRDESSTISSFKGHRAGFNIQIMGWDQAHELWTCHWNFPMSPSTL